MAAYQEAVPRLKKSEGMSGVLQTEPGGQWELKSLRALRAEVKRWASGRWCWLMDQAGGQPRGQKGSLCTDLSWWLYFSHSRGCLSYSSQRVVFSTYRRAGDHPT